MLKRILNSDVGYYIYTGLVIVAGIGSLIFFYFMVTGFNIGVYDENTMIGSVYVGGLDESEAEQKLRSRISEWLEDDEVVYEIGYQGYYYTFDRELFTFDVEETMSNVSEGTTTPIAVSYSPGALNTIEFEISQEAFMTDDLLNVFDFEAVIADVLEDAAMLREFSRMELSNYFADRDQAVETINDATMPYQEGVNGSGLLAKIADAHEDSTVTLGPRETFSVQEQFGESFTSSELNTIGSILLEAILPTDMVVIERHYNSQIDFSSYYINADDCQDPAEDYIDPDRDITDKEEFPYFGRNIRVNRNVGYDFVFENVNEQTYEFEFYEASDDYLGVRLIGPPYLDEITITTEPASKTCFAFDTETTTDPQSERIGRPGMAVIIRRQVRDIFDEPVEDYEVVFEYYPPINAVEPEE